METTETKSPIEQIYDRCNELQDIRQRISDSEREAADFNSANAKKIRKSRKNVNATFDANQPQAQVASYAIRYADHFEITEVFKNKKWTVIASFPKTGAEEFGNSILAAVQRHNPKGIRIKVYKGKPKSTNFDYFDCWIATNPDSDPDIQAERSKAENQTNTDAKYLELEKKIDAMIPGHVAGADAASGEILKMQFNEQLKELRHEREIEKIRAEYKETIKAQQAEIGKLNDTIDELNEQLDEKEDELLGATEMIEQKIEKPDFFKVLTELGGSILHRGVNKIIKERPTFMVETFGSEIFDKLAPESNPPAIENTGAENQGASFTPVQTYPNQTDPKHIEAAQSATAFINNLEMEELKQLWSAIAFCVDDDGHFSPEKTAQLIEAVDKLSQTN